MMFKTSYREILAQVDEVDPVAYGRSRNFLDGAVSRLSPYISRGVISTRQVMQRTLARGFEPSRIEKWIQELAWRDYWQQVWVARGSAIDADLRQPQPGVKNHEMPRALVDAETGITAIDEGIELLYRTGYLHNHLRMYVAAIACNVGASHWKVPARWMYYHLRDGDWASNALSWQWVAGSNSHKKYLANQDNINKYCGTSQRGTFLDVPYDAFQSLEIPPEISDLSSPSLQTMLPAHESVSIDPRKPTLIYNYYNLDPRWRSAEDANRILLLEPSVFARYPISRDSVEFALALGKNIESLQVFVGEFDDLVAAFSPREIFFKEHPLNSNYRGTEDSRDWMSGVSGYYPSFFKFWNKARRELKRPRDVIDQV